MWRVSGNLCTRETFNEVRRPQINRGIGMWLFCVFRARESVCENCIASSTARRRGECSSWAKRDYATPVGRSWRKVRRIVQLVLDRAVEEEAVRFRRRVEISWSGQSRRTVYSTIVPFVPLKKLAACFRRRVEVSWLWQRRPTTAGSVIRSIKFFRCLEESDMCFPPFFHPIFLTMA